MCWFVFMHVMTAMHFSPKFIDNILELYQNTFTQFKTVFGYTNKVYLHSGVRQGDTISPTLFILSLAPLIHKIDRLNLQTLSSGSSQHVLTFADDTLLLTANALDTQRFAADPQHISTNRGTHIYTHPHTHIQNKTARTPTQNTLTSHNNKGGHHHTRKHNTQQTATDTSPHPATA